MEAALRWLAEATPASAELLRLMDATPVPCGQSVTTARRPDLYGYADYGYCKDQPANRPAPGTAIVTDKSLSGEDTEAFFASPDLSLTLIRPARKDETTPRPFPNWLRQRIEAIIWTLKNQLGLERHGGRVPGRPVGPRPPAPTRAQRLHLAQLADRRAGQALPHRIRSLSCP